MTVPVTVMEKSGNMTMQFYLPSEFDKNNTPNPTSSDVEVITIEGGYYAVIRYSGRASENNFIKHKNNLEDENEIKNEDDQISPEEKLIELEDKLARAFAEMKNQRRRFEKEKEDAFEYGGFSFAKEALNLIDNLERSKQVFWLNPEGKYRWDTGDSVMTKYSAYCTKVFQCGNIDQLERVVSTLLKTAI